MTYIETSGGRQPTSTDRPDGRVDVTFPVGGVPPQQDLWTDTLRRVATDKGLEVQASAEDEGVAVRVVVSSDPKVGYAVLNQIPDLLREADDAFEEATEITNPEVHDMVRNWWVEQSNK